jgi:PASTA domain-containing protein/List-Bact-rpt repeat protein
MRFGFGARVVVSAIVASAFVGFGLPSPSGAVPPGRHAMPGRTFEGAVTGAGWGAGIEAALPANASATNGSFTESISCPSAGNCSAVGSYIDDAGNTQGLLLTETAGSWATGVEAVLPANASDSTPAPGIAGAFVRSVSCASAGNCTAVGSYPDSSGNQQGLLLTETAGTWSAGVEAPLPANASSSNQFVQWGSVSCASAGNCAAVGQYRPVGQLFQGLLLTETDGVWSAGVEAAPASPAAWLDSVSCASSGNCTAVGSAEDGSGVQQGLLITEAAGSWGPPVEAALPADSTNQGAEVDSVSCASAGNCTAVGWYDPAWLSLGTADTVPIAKGLLLNETAGSWGAGVEATLPAGADGSNSVNSLYPPAVSCPSAGNCGVAGSYYDSTQSLQGLLLTEAAGSWATGAEAMPAITAAGPGFVNAVSCASPGNCGALINGDRLLTETAGSWAAGVEPSLPPNAATGAGALLYAVSCPSAGDCSAVGQYPDSSGAEGGLLLGGSPPLVKLDIAKSGTGSGNVSSVPNGIGCGLTCSVSVDAGAAVALTATPSPGSRFSGWSGGGCSGTGTCHPNTAISEQTVTATFIALGTLNVSKNGTGSGRVSSVPAGIDCGSTCSAPFDVGSSVTLTATPSPGSRFSGWSAFGCARIRSCQDNDVGRDQTVTATFDLLPKCIVPRLRGKPLKAAERALRSNHCSVGKIKHAASRTVRKGYVISQKPKPGRRLKRGARVTLLISRGKR